MEPIRILHENVMMDPGGIETQLMRIYRNIDRSKVQFDFLLHRTQEGAYDSEIRELGGHIYYAKPFNPFRYAEYYHSMSSFFKAHPEYKIMIAHTELALTPLICAKRAKVPMRICYSHNGRFAFSLKRCFMDYETLFLKKYCTDMFAVSKLAARYTFGNKAVENGDVRIIQNGIHVEDFVFDEDIRKQKRKELGMEDKFIVGHVGRFMFQKNHMFLLEIFAEILSVRKDARNDAQLVLVGEGRLEDDIRKKAAELNITNNVTLLGRRSDVNDLMKAMDVLLLPSFWEGFPNVAIEAQASALPVYMSENITEEAEFTPYCTRLPLEIGANEWAKRICNDALSPLPRKDMSQAMLEKGCNVRATAKWYEKFYLEQYKRLSEKEGII